jgi:hypothetical protein
VRRLRRGRAARRRVSTIRDRNHPDHARGVASRRGHCDGTRWQLSSTGTSKRTSWSVSRPPRRVRCRRRSERRSTR